MRPFGAWFGRLAMAGVCLAGAGCGGGGDVPDPDSDRRAAPAEGPRKIVDKSVVPEAPAAEAEAKAEPTALASNAPVPEPEKAAEAEKAAPALKGDSSATDEMLRSATTPGATPPAGETPGGSGSAPSNPGSAGGSAGGPAPSPSLGTPAAPGGSAGGAAPGPSLGTPSAPGGSAGGPAQGPSLGTPAAPGGSAGGYGAAPNPETQPGPGGGRMNRMRPGMANGDQPSAPGMPPTAPVPGGGGPPGTGGFGGLPSPGMPGGGPGGYGGSGSAAADTLGPNAFRTPQGAVMAFLAALKSKNKDRIAKTTALRAPNEAAEKHRKIFSEIVDGSISDEDVDEMAKALEGFQVMQVLQAKSTRRVDVVVSKMSGKDRLQRTIVTRQEKDGWKVLDIEAMYDFKPGLPPMMRGRGTGRRR